MRLGGITGWLMAAAAAVLLLVLTACSDTSSPEAHATVGSASVGSGVCPGSVRETVMDYGHRGDEPGPRAVANSVLSTASWGLPSGATAKIHRVSRRQAVIRLAVVGDFVGKVRAIALADGKWVASRISVCE